MPTRLFEYLPIFESEERVQTAPRILEPTSLTLTEDRLEVVLTTHFFERQQREVMERE